jgi:hypothetical protein
MNVEGGWELELIFLWRQLMNRWTYRNEVQCSKEIVDTRASFIWIAILFDEGFKYGDGAKFWGYIGTNAEALCIELCNIVQCHIFVK